METFIISQANREEINRWLKKYPPEQKRSAVITALLLVQEQNGGWLTEAAMKAVAEYLQLAPMDVYEVATFYDLYELEPIGKNKISICTNISCMLRGSEKLVDYIKQRYQVGLDQTTADQQFTFRSSECLAACGGAPMCQVNNKEYHLNLTPEKLGKILDDLEHPGGER